MSIAARRGTDSRATRSLNWLALSSLFGAVVGFLLGFLIYCAPYFGGLLCLVAIPVGGAGLRAARSRGGTAVAAIGIAIGLAGVILFALGTALNLYPGD